MCSDVVMSCNVQLKENGVRRRRGLRVVVAIAKRCSNKLLRLDFGRQSERPTLY